MQSEDLSDIALLVMLTCRVRGLSPGWFGSAVQTLRLMNHDDDAF